MKTNHTMNSATRTPTVCLRHFGRLLCLSTLSVFTLVIRLQAANGFCGDTITNSIGVAGEVDQYTYGGSAGEKLALSFWGPLDCFNGNGMALDLYNPAF